MLQRIGAMLLLDSLARKFLYDGLQQAHVLGASGLGDGAVPPPSSRVGQVAGMGTLVCHVSPPSMATGQTVVSFHPLYELHNGLPFDVDLQLTSPTSLGEPSRNYRVQIATSRPAQTDPHKPKQP